MEKFRNKLSNFAQKKITPFYKSLYRLRDYWRVKRQDIFPYRFDKNRYPNLFLSKDYEPFPGIESKVERVIWCFWTGDNEMTENRKRGYESLVKNSGVEVRLITPENLLEYILPEYPLHKGYEYLSLNHRSDYLRCYFIHFYGGGYYDIKPLNNSWVDSFELLENSDKWFLSYTQFNRLSLSKGQGIIDKDLRYYYRKCVGTGAFISKSNTKFTTEWWIELNKRMDENFDELQKFPGDMKGRNKGYPLSLLSISTQIMCPLNLKYNDKLIHDDRVLPILKDYQ